jgi:hypothetical protein
MLTKQQKKNLKELADVINDAQEDCIKRGGKPVTAPAKADNRTTAIFINKKKK